MLLCPAVDGHIHIIGSTQSVLVRSANIFAHLQPAGLRPGLLSHRQLSQATVRPLAGKRLPGYKFSGQTVPTKAATSSMPSARQQSQAPFRPMAANGQHTSSSIAPVPLKRAPSRKRGRAALAEEHGTVASASIVDAAAASTRAPPTVSHDAARDMSASINGQVKQPDADEADAGVNAAAVDHQLNHSSTARPKRNLRQTKASAAIKQGQTSGDIKQEPAGLSGPGELLDGSASAAIIDGQSTKPAVKPGRKPRQSKAAAAAVEQVHQQQTVKPDPESASDVDLSDVSLSAAPAANGVHAEVAAGSKAKPKRKPRQTKAAAAAAAAAAVQNGDAAAGNSGAAPAPAKLDRRKKAKIENVVAEVKAEVAEEAAEQDPAVAEAPVQGIDEHQPRKIPRTTKSAAAAGTGISASETSEESDAAVAKVPAQAKGRARASRPKKAPAPDDDSTAGLPEASQGAPAKAKPPRKRAPKKVAPPAGDAQGSMSDTSCEEVNVAGSESVKKVPKSRKKFKNELTIRLVAAAKAALAAPETVVVPPLPVPNLGYACLNSTLQAQKPTVTSNRGAILRTFNEKGLVYISQLALQNCKDLLPIVQWNHEHSIRLFRLSSDLFPWGDSGKYKLEELPDLPEIEAVLAEVGTLARLYKQRLTSHPSEFVKMAAQKDDIVWKSLFDLEVHSRVFDMMGYEPNMWNKINIHIGGTYGNTIEDKQATLERFVLNFQRLSPNVKKRLAVENDDKATQWSIADLLPLHDRIGVPITFDFHHHRFCQGELTEEQAFKAAIATWPEGVRPQVHWSEEPEDPEKVRRAHSKYIRGPMNLHGHDADVDIMVEAKAKELTVLDFRHTAHLNVDLPVVPGTLDTPDLVKAEYQTDVDGAEKARLAVEEQERQNVILRAEQAKAAEASGAHKFL